MNTFSRLSALLVIIMGIATLAFGILFIFQAGSAEQQVADEISPLAISEVDAKYDLVAAQQKAIATVEEPKIQGKTAGPSDTYNYLSAQRSLLALARTNIGLATFLRMSGIMGIIMGFGLMLAGLGLFRK
jgi:uncharacterized membrane protein YidH (DUF202 family)